MKHSKLHLIAALAVSASLESAPAFAGSEYKELPTVTVTAKRKGAVDDSLWSRLISALLATGGGGRGGGGGRSDSGRSSKDPIDGKDPSRTCEQYASALAPFMTDNPYDELGDSISRDSDVILLGEDHQDVNSQLKYPDIFAKLKASHGADCVAFEKLPENFFTLFSSNPSHFCQNIQDYYSTEYDRAAAAARCLGMNVYSLDVFDTKNVSASYSNEGMEIRNDMMARGIYALIESKSCKKVIMINGASHLYSKVQGKLQPLPEKLALKGLKTHSLFVASGVGARNLQGIVPKECVGLFRERSAVVGMEKAANILDWSSSKYDGNAFDQMLRYNSTFVIFKDGK